jgi:hypothetical protein
LELSKLAKIPIRETVTPAYAFPAHSIILEAVIIIEAWLPGVPEPLQSRSHGLGLRSTKMPIGILGGQSKNGK